MIILGIDTTGLSSSNHSRISSSNMSVWLEDKQKQKPMEGYNSLPFLFLYDINK